MSDRLRVADAKIILYKRNGAAALFGGMIVPLAAPDSDAVVAGHAVLRPGADELFALTAQELHEIHRAGPELLLLGKMDIGHFTLLFAPEECDDFKLCG